MAKLIYIFLFSLSFFAYASLAQAYSEFPMDSTLEVFSESGKKGVRNDKGAVVMAAEYQDFGWSDTSISKQYDYIGFKRNQVWGLMNNEFEIVSAAQFQSLVPFNESLFIGSKKSSYSQINFYGLINQKGKSKIDFKYRNLHAAGQYLIAAGKEDQDILFGVLDASGKVKIPFKYYHIGYLGNQNFTLTHRDGRKELIKFDSKVKALLSDVDSVSNFKDGVAIVFKDGKQGLIRQDGKILLPIAYKEIAWNNGQKIQVTPLDEWIVFDNKGEKKAQFCADSAFYLNDSILIKNTSEFAQIYNVRKDSDKQLFHGEVRGLLGDYFILKKDQQFFLAEDSTNILEQKFSSQLFLNEAFFAGQQKVFSGKKSIIYNSSGKSIEADTFHIEGDRLFLKMKLHWGLYNQDFEEILPPLYQSIKESSPNVFVVQFNDMWGVVDSDNEWIVPPLYLRIEAIDAHYFKLIDKYLQEYISDGNEKLQAALYYNFYGRYGVEQNVNNQSRLIAHNGTPISEFKAGKYVGHGELGVLFRNHNKHFLLDSAGNRLFEVVDYDSLIVTGDEYLAVLKNGSWGFVDHNGKLRIANRYDTVRTYQNGRAAVKIRNSWGFIDRQESLVIQPYFSYVSDFNHQTANVEINKKFGIVDEKGQYILEAEYDEIVKQGIFYLLRKGSKWGVANLDGKVLAYPTFDSISVVGQYLKVEKFGTTRILNSKGNNLIDSQFHEIIYDVAHDLFIAQRRATKEQVFLTDILQGKYP